MVQPISVGKPVSGPVDLLRSIAWSQRIGDRRNDGCSDGAYRLPERRNDMSD